LECDRVECGASLCPLDNEINDKCWYANDEICKYRKVNQCQFIKTQRKIQRKTKGRDPVDVGYFTFQMLNRNIKVYKGIKGLDPNCHKDTESERIEKWLNKHPVIIVTEKLRERGRRLAEYKNKLRSKNGIK